MLWKRPLHPTVIPMVSVPAFLLGGLLAGINWINLGERQKGANTIKSSLWGTAFMVALILATPKDLAVKLWPVWLGVNLGVGMALRKLQLPAYIIWRSR